MNLNQIEMGVIEEIAVCEILTHLLFKILEVQPEELKEDEFKNREEENSWKLLRCHRGNDASKIKSMC